MKLCELLEARAGGGAGASSRVASCVRRHRAPRPPRRRSGGHRALPRARHRYGRPSSTATSAPTFSTTRPRGIEHRGSRASRWRDRPAAGIGAGDTHPPRYMFVRSFPVVLTGLARIAFSLSCARPGENPVLSGSLPKGVPPASLNRAFSGLLYSPSAPGLA